MAMPHAFDRVPPGSSPKDFYTLNSKGGILRRTLAYKAAASRSPAIPITGISERRLFHLYERTEFSRRSEAEIAFRNGLTRIGVRRRHHPRPMLRIRHLDSLSLQSASPYCQWRPIGAA